jgi:hypothetical protein
MAIEHASAFLDCASDASIERGSSHRPKWFDKCLLSQ